MRRIQHEMNVFNIFYSFNAIFDALDFKNFSEEMQILSKKIKKSKAIFNVSTMT